MEDKPDVFSEVLMQLNHPRGARPHLLDHQTRSMCRIILAAFWREITDCLGLRCFPAWQGAGNQADAEPNGETVPPAQSAQQLVCPLSPVLSGNHPHFSGPGLQSSSDATRLGRDRS